MGNQSRMSPLTALVIGVFGVGAVTIASATAVILYGLRIVDRGAFEALALVEDTVGLAVEKLPDTLDSLPEVVEQLLNDRQGSTYLDKLEVAAVFLPSGRPGERRPVLTIVNKGSEVVSLLTVRVVALNRQGFPVGEWTEVVATPIGISNEWRGRLYPGETRYVVMAACLRGLSSEMTEDITATVEISDLRISNPLGNDS